MKLKIYRDQTESSGILGGKKYIYSLKIVAEIMPKETELLDKYDYLNETYPVISPEFEHKDFKGPRSVSPSQLQKGVQWSCSFLPESFVKIPAAVKAWAEDALGVAAFRETWGGEEVVDI